MSLSLAVLCALPGAGWGQTPPEAGFPAAFPPFPQRTGFEDIRLWIAGNTDLTASQVVLTSAEAVFSFQDVAPSDRSGDQVTRQVREEVISQPLAETLGGRSVTAKITFDCAHAETTVDEVMLYPGNSLKGGDPQQIPATRWLAANVDLDLTDLAQVACARPHASPAPPAVAETAPPTAAATPSSDDEQGLWAQIGAFASIAMADQKWMAIQKRWPDQTEFLSERTENTPHNGGVLRRTLVGPFGDPAKAKAFCQTLRAAGDPCLVR